jgi:uncharacterized protein (DUF849 family)
MHFDKLIINAALTGIVPTKAENPNLPCSPSEIAADVRRCRDAGASIVHIHARDHAGQATYKKQIYYEIFSRIRSDVPDIIICGSCSGRIFAELDQRCEVLAPAPGCQPDLASLTLGSMNFPAQASVNPPDTIRALAEAMNSRGIVPEWEIFDLGMIDYAHHLIGKGILKKPYYCNIILGSLGTLNASAYNLAAAVRALPAGTLWSAAGIGRFQFYVNSLALAMGGHVRVGLEDNLYYDIERKHPATNPGLIDRIVNLARALGRDVACPDEARQIIGLPPRTAPLKIKAAPSPADRSRSLPPPGPLPSHRRTS